METAMFIESPLPPLPPLRRVGKHGYPNSLLLVITLRPMRTQRRIRTFFERLRLHAREQGLLMAHKFGVCVFFGAERICNSAHRRDLVNWLIDRPEVDRVFVSGLTHLRDLTQPKRQLATHDVRDTEIQAASLTVQRIALGVTKYWQAYLVGKA
jgi:hypothetical protein